MKIVYGGNEMHVAANPKQGTKSEKRIPTHYRNIAISRRENASQRAWPTPNRTPATYAYKRPDLIYERKPV